MSSATLAPPDVRTLADVVAGAPDGVPLDRVIWLGRPATEEDQLAFLDGDDKRIVELVDGYLVEKPMGNPESSHAAWLLIALGGFAVPRNLGVFGGEAMSVRTTPTRNRAPDITFTTWGLIPRGHQNRTPAPYAPELTVEVLSPTNTRREMDEKRREYFGAGCRLYWEVDPAQLTVAVYTGADAPDVVLTLGDTLAGDPVLPGFAASVSALFGYLDGHPDQPEPPAEEQP